MLSENYSTHWFNKKVSPPLFKRDNRFGVCRGGRLSKIRGINSKELGGGQWREHCQGELSGVKGILARPTSEFLWKAAQGGQIPKVGDFC